MKALFMGCHCDDIELGCGGTLHKRKDDWEIVAVVFSDCGPFGQLRELRDYSQKSLVELGASQVRFYDFPTNDFWQHRQKLWEITNSLEKELSPDIVFTQRADHHQDHRSLYEETIRNFKKVDVVSYQSSIRNSFDHKWNWFEVLAQSDVDAKLRVLDNYPCYRDSKVYFNPKNVVAALRACAMCIEEEYAEAFELVKKVN